MDTETLLTVQEAALRLGISESAIRNATLEGRLPFVHKFNRKLIEETALLCYQQRTQIGGYKPKGRPPSREDDGKAATRSKLLRGEAAAETEIERKQKR